MGAKKSDVEGVGGPAKRRFAKVFNPVSMVQNHDRDLVDINKMISNFTEKGIVPVNVRPLIQGDFTQANGLQDMMNKLIAAQAAFDALPSAVRKEFRNNPVNLVDFVSDNKNYDRAIELGLLDPERVAKRKPQVAAGSDKK